jgi:hypothetical protein
MEITDAYDSVPHSTCKYRNFFYVCTINTSTINTTENTLVPLVFEVPDIRCKWFSLN